MAKRRRPDLDNIFARTTPEPVEAEAETEATKPAEPEPSTQTRMVPASGESIPVSVDLRESEIEMLQEIAQNLGIPYTTIIRLAVRRLLGSYEPKG